MATTCISLCHLPPQYIRTCYQHRSMLTAAAAKAPATTAPAAAAEAARLCLLPPLRHPITRLPCLALHSRDGVGDGLIGSRWEPKVLADGNMECRQRAAASSA